MAFFGRWGGTSRDCPTWVSNPYSDTKPRHYCWCQELLADKEPDIAVSWEALPEPVKYRCGCLQPTITLSTGIPMEELGDWRSRRGLQPHRKNNNINQWTSPELPGTKPPTTWIALSGISGRGGPWFYEGSMSQCREMFQR